MCRSSCCYGPRVTGRRSSARARDPSCASSRRSTAGGCSDTHRACCCSGSFCCQCRLSWPSSTGLNVGPVFCGGRTAQEPKRLHGRDNSPACGRSIAGQSAAATDAPAAIDATTTSATAAASAKVSLRYSSRSGALRQSAPVAALCISSSQFVLHASGFAGLSCPSSCL